MRTGEIHVELQFQVCQGCSIEKPILNFAVRNDRSGRHRPYCNLCGNDYKKARYDYHKRTQPFKHKVNRAKNRAAYAKVPFDLDEDYLRSIWTGICPVLGKQIHLYDSGRSDEFAAELDRFYPHIGYTKGNVNFLSRKINRIKNNATVNELVSLIEWMRVNENK